MRIVSHYRLLSALAVCLCGVPGIAAAQIATTPVAVYPNSGDPSDRLTANLTILARNPRDLNALIGAGESAIAVGDGNAALSFLARAEEISPVNGRIKAALGSALVLLERPGEALKLFSEASALGIPEGDLARDRGLAYDLRGDSRRAQRDYLMAQRLKQDDEVTRRLALSYGISGDKANALSLLDPLIRKQDQAAWRARAFILAMNGDVAGAEAVTRQVMPVGMGDTMTPFLRRLGGLNPAERALAVNFGTMPGDGQRYAAVETGDPFRPAGGTNGALIPAGDPPRTQVAVAVPPRPAEPPSRDPRRRPGQTETKLAARDPLPAAPTGRPNVQEARPGFSQPVVPKVSTTQPVAQRVGQRIGPVDPNALPPELRELVKPVEPVATKQAKNAPVAPAPNITIVSGTLPPPSGVREAPPQQLASLPAPKLPEARPPEPKPVEPKPVEPKPVQVASLPAAVAPAPIFEIPSTPGASPVASDAAVMPNLVPTPLPPAPLEALKAPTPVPNPEVVAPAAVLTQKPVPPLSTEPVRPLQASPPAQLAATVTPPKPEPPKAEPLKPEPAPDATFGPPALANVQLAAVTPTAVPSVAPTAVPPVTPVVEAAPVAEPAGLASIIAGIEPEAESAAGPLPTASEIRAFRLAAQRKAAAEAKAKADAKTGADIEAKAEKEKKEAEKAKLAKSPPRIWVQVATGANEAGLPGTWKRVRDKSPTTFKGMSASTTPFKATNRVLVGPFKSAAEAKKLVGAMQKAGLSGSTYNSEAGQEISKLAGR